jgi:hypothetical protein
LLVLLDTTILTNFALVGLTALLKDLWGDWAATNKEVLEEYATGVKTGKLPNENSAHLTIVTLSSAEHVLGIKLFPKYGKGLVTVAENLLISMQIREVNPKYEETI